MTWILHELNPNIECTDRPGLAPARVSAYANTKLHCAKVFRIYIMQIRYVMYVTMDAQAYTSQEQNAENY